MIGFLSWDDALDRTRVTPGNPKRRHRVGTQVSRVNRGLIHGYRNNDWSTWEENVSLRVYRATSPQYAN